MGQGRGATPFPKSYAGAAPSSLTPCFPSTTPKRRCCGTSGNCPTETSPSTGG
jgi:hypothetical protein